MVDNELYNLFMQITQEMKSLWRIDKMYEDDAQSCDECKKFWEKMKKDKEAHVAELKDLIRKHI